MARDLDVFLQAHRFALEDMAELMARVFPPEGREEQPEDALVDDEPGPAGTTQPSLSSMALRTPNSSRRGPPPMSSSTTWWLGGIAGAAILLVVALLYPLARHRGAARAPVEPTVPAKVEAPPEPHVVAEQAPPPVPVPVEVRLVTDPPGAQVYEGPKLVGTAPLSLHVDAAHPALITLLHAGYEDLNYTVQPTDAPQLTLRLLRRRHELHRPVATPTPGRAQPHKLRVDTLDENNAAPRVPKVTPIDD
jgi:hypothetical protein